MNAIKFSPSAQNFAQTQQTAMKPRQMAFRAEEEAAAEIMPEIQSEQQPKEGMSTVAKAGITAAVAVAACLTRGAVKTKAITGKFLGEGLLKNSNPFTKAFWQKTVIAALDPAVKKVKPLPRIANNDIITPDTGIKQADLLTAEEAEGMKVIPRGEFKPSVQKMQADAEIKPSESKSTPGFLKTAEEKIYEKK